MTRVYRPDWAWTGDTLVREPLVAVDEDGVLVEPDGSPATAVEGILLPGLVNAHTHLELGPIRFERGHLVDWVRALRAQSAPNAPQASAGVLQVIQGGAAAVGEVSNTGLSRPAITAARLAAVTWHEVLGIDADTLPPVERPTPHGPHSTSPALIRACAAPGAPWSIHFDEDPDEAAFLRGEGPWVDFIRGLGRDLGRFPFPGLSPAAWLEELGVLGPRALLVHATCTRGPDLDRVAASGARVCLCVRSNRAITGRLPDVYGMVARGIPLAVGTDSLASVPDLDLFAEGAALTRAFPDVPAEVWLGALTAGGADALGLPMGRLRLGTAPGLLRVAVSGDDPLGALFDGTRRPRRWLACPRA